MTRNFEIFLGIAPVSMKHAKCSDDKDLMLMVNELHKASVYYYTPGRHHTCFSNFAANLFNRIDQTKLSVWMKKQFKRQLKDSFLNR